MVYSVLGSNYGDEGKGLATDYLSMKSKNTLVVRHNGGAQSGHTVEQDGKRFIFHELSSGSFRGADTYWAPTFLPDIYKLSEEVESFRILTGGSPLIFVSERTCITTIDDILINMLLESARGDKRHGSCGMGINEADLRNKAGYGISMKELLGMNVQELLERLIRIREEYTARHMEELGLNENISSRYLEESGMEDDAMATYYDMLNDETILHNYAEQVVVNLRYISGLAEPKEVFAKYENIIFENGQGLRLDAEFEENWPHVTASRTGLTNVLKILDEAGMKLDEAVYVTRSYLTKHGAGFIKNEDEDMKKDLGITDETNVPNEWQGSLRYSKWDNIEEFLRVIKADKDQSGYPVKASLMITHLNETDNEILFQNRNISVDNFMKCNEVRDVFDGYYLSKTRFAEDIKDII